MKIVYPFDYSILEKKDNYRIWIHWLFWSFSHEAAEKIFPTVFPDNNYELVELVDSENVFNNVSEWTVDIWICAIANSWSWCYTETIKAISSNNVKLLSTTVMPLNMCLVTKKEINNFEDINKIYWHPVAIRQCEEKIKKFLTDTPIEPCSDKMDTALSAKLLSEWDLDSKTWVFCSEKTIDLYDNLKVFKSEMHHDPRNATFFIIFTK
jgi:prephenate dehydratase